MEILKKTTCLFCSMGCSILIKVKENEPIEIEYDFENPINKGSVCPRGNYMFELLGHRQRILTPMAREGETLKKTTWEKAFSEILEKINDIKGKYGKDSIAILMDPSSLNEEIYLGYTLANNLKTKNFSVAFPFNDYNLLYADRHFKMRGEKEATFEDIRNSDLLLIIGDIITTSPCLSKDINKVKYGSKNHKVIVIDSKKSRTSWFANNHLMCAPYKEHLILLSLIKAVFELKKGNSKTSLSKIIKEIDAESLSKDAKVSFSKILEAAKDFNESKKGTVIISPSFGRVIDPGLILKLSKILCSLSSGDKRVIEFYSAGNSLGAYLTLSPFDEDFEFLNVFEIFDKILKGEIKALLSFGVNVNRVVSKDEFLKIKKNLKLYVLSHIFGVEDAHHADYILPSSSFSEKEGSIVSTSKIFQEIEPVLPPFSDSRSYFDIILGMLGGMGIEKIKIKDLTEKIKKQIYKIKTPKAENSEEVIRNAIQFKDFGSKEFTLLLDDDIFHYLDRSITERCHFAKIKSPEPYLEISPLDSKTLGIFEGKFLRVCSSRGEVSLKAKVSESVSKGILFAPHHFDNILKIFKKEIDSKTHCVLLYPEKVSILKD